MVERDNPEMENQFAFDTQGDPANRPRHGTHGQRAFDSQTRLANSLNYLNPAEMREDGFRPKVREKAASYSQQEVEDFIQNRLKNPPVRPSQFDPNSYPGERAEYGSHLAGVDELNIRDLIESKQNPETYTQVERQAYGHYPSYGLDDPIRRKDIYQPDKFEYITDDEGYLQLKD
tara:strand:+ start:367 stop:891 length:525 start_codon:yes stop_codon:yes gene_type:complete